MKTMEEKRLIRCIHSEAYQMSDEELREELKGGMIYVLYGFNNYACNLTHINELRNLILQDYPETKDEDIEVRFIERSRSKHARRTMLSTSIPVEDFIRLRANDKIDVW